MLLSLPLAQADNAWMTAWLTPIWFLAAGVAIGMIVLTILILAFRLLSRVPFWAALSGGPAGHAVAALLSIGMTAAIWQTLPKWALGGQDLNEPLLLGIALFLLCSIIGWSLVFCSSKRAANNSLSTLTEGAASYVAACAATLVLIGGSLWGIGYVTPEPIVASPIKALVSIPQVFSTGQNEATKTIEAAPENGEAPFVKFELDLDFDLLSRLEITSDKSVILGDAETSEAFNRVPIRLAASETLSWSKLQKIEELPVPYDEGSILHVQNREIDPATITVTYVTNPPVPEAVTLLITALGFVLVGLTLLLQQAVAPRTSAVAHATIKNELAQPLFLVLMLLGVLAIVLYVFLSFNTFGEDIKLLKECGITTIMLLAAFQGIWSASSSISEEIEGKTALTVLSKPIQRRSFVIGKFLGIFWVLMLMFLILGAFELVAVSYKPIYDAREAATEAPTWQLCHLEMVSTVPGLLMAFMQSVVLMSISVALATRLPQLANLSVCFAIYVIGNLTTSLVSSTSEGFEIVRFIASLISTIIPILEHFSLQAAIDSGNQITMSLLSGNLVYCLLYVLLAMFLALLLFEDRDLA